MTLIIGVHCQDGIVLGADSLRTYSSLIEQEVSDKIEIADNNVLVASSGEVGLSQLIKRELHDYWSEVKRQASVSHARNAITDAMFRHVQPASVRARAMNREFESCGIVVAFPFRDELLLLTYDTFANSFEITPDSPFVSLGSANFQADPFLAFIKRVLWNDSAPNSVREGAFGVLWTLDHVSRVNAGLGVGGQSRIATLEKVAGRWQAQFLSDSLVDVYKAAILDAEDSLRIFGQRLEPR